jgi:hypothetical protein
MKILMFVALLSASMFAEVAIPKTMTPEQEKAALALVMKGSAPQNQETCACMGQDQMCCRTAAGGLACYEDWNCHRYPVLKPQTPIVPMGAGFERARMYRLLSTIII